jgi:mono/diheme cytochrome c family protein
VAGIWKSNFEKVYRFSLESPGTFKGEQFEGSVTIDRMVQEGNKVRMSFRFKAEQGEATLKLNCKENKVILKGDFTLPGRTGGWTFTKLKNEKTTPSGQDLFTANCTVCHLHDQTKTKVGPGLKGLFKNPKLPTTGRPTDESTIRQQIRKGGTKMPPFPALSEQDLSALIEYLKSL